MAGFKQGDKVRWSPDGHTDWGYEIVGQDGDEAGIMTPVGGFRIVAACELKPKDPKPTPKPPVRHGDYIEATSKKNPNAKIVGEVSLIGPDRFSLRTDPLGLWIAFDQITIVKLVPEMKP
jgi:hypothetical protein